MADRVISTVGTAQACGNACETRPLSGVPGRKAEALFDDGQHYPVRIHSERVGWGRIQELFEQAGLDAALPGLAARAGEKGASASTWASVTYEGWENTEWIPEQWITPGAYACLESWSQLWAPRLHAWRARHFRSAPAQTVKDRDKAGEPQLKDPQDLPVKVASQPLKEAPEGVPLKYWARRRALWSRWHAGIRMDRESWFSVTPEAAALRTARMLGRLSAGAEVTPTSPCIHGFSVLDPFCGCGGNAVQLALQCSALDGSGGVVVAGDTCLERLEHAQHNASLYGVSATFVGEPPSAEVSAPCSDARLLLVHCNAVDLLLDGAAKVLSLLQATLSSSSTAAAPPLGAVLLAPPWGGVAYAAGGPFSLRSIAVSCRGTVLDGAALVWLAAAAAPRVVLFLPRHVDAGVVEKELQEAAPEDARWGAARRTGTAKPSYLANEPLIKWDSLKSKGRCIGRLLCLDWEGRPFSRE